MAYKSIRDSDEKSVYDVSIAPELYHASSLIHGDIMDEDLLRRNKPTMHRLFELYFKNNFKDKHYKGYLFDSASKRFSLSLAIVQGNVLYSLSNSCILGSNLDENQKYRSLRMFGDAYLRTNEGQIFDILLSSGENIREEQYLEMASGKTASLFEASIKFGAMVNNAKPFQLENLSSYAKCVALAFQIYDDILDYSKKMSKGRNLGTDLRKGNRTLIMIKALQNSNDRQKNFLLDVLGNDKASNKDVEKSIKIIKETGALEYSSKLANKKVEEAKIFLGKSNITDCGFNFFNNLADYVIERKV
jgi:geranylgeranyl diphosphate synthase, type I